MPVTAQGSGSYRLRILHISDLHERGPREKEPWRKRRMFGDAWERNLAELVQDGPFDLICFTGDVADWGQPGEYAQATDFCYGLLDRLRVSAERLFVIPGNHDIMRKVETEVWEKMRMLLSAGIDPLDFSRWMNGIGSAPPGMDSSWPERILTRQSAYRQWVRDILKRPELAPEGLGYRASVQIDTWPFPIHVLGLDTAWLCGDDSDKNHLWLTENQLMTHASAPDGNLVTGLRLALMHHPFQELADEVQIRRRMGEVADLVLRGHLHETEIETWADPDRKLRQAAAGCLYEGHRADQYPNACQAITIECNAQGRPFRIELRFRAWSARGGHWYDDDSLYRETKQGRLTWVIEQAPVFARAENPYSPWHADPLRFVGRKQLLRQLETAFERNQSVSLVGDWRVGKTMLLKTWLQRVEARGRIARMVSGERIEGHSVADFVTVVTGLTAPNDADGAADKLNLWAESVGRSGPPVLLVDEADGLIAKFDYRFFERLRGMLGRIIVVLASRQELDLLFKDVGRGSPLANLLEIQWVGLLDQHEADELIARGAKVFGPNGEQLIRHWAGRHPFYIELLGYYLAEAQLSAQALDRFTIQANARLRELWNVLNDKERRALQDGVAGIPATRASLRRRGLVNEDGSFFGEVLSAWLKEEL